LLAILTFSLSLVGTFLVRSGVLTSVHAFAVDAQRGVYILGIIAVATGLALALFAWRAPSLRTGALFAPLSREGAITLNNVLLVTLTSIVFLGTFYPIVDPNISVGAPYYNRWFGIVAAFLLFLVSFGPMLNWRRNDFASLLRRLGWPLAIAAVALAVSIIVFGIDSLLAALGLALGVLLVLGAIAVLARRLIPARTLGSSARQLLRATPLAVWGLAIAHAGLGVSTIGVTATSAFQSSNVLAMVPGQSVLLDGRRVTLETVGIVRGANYEADQAQFRIEGPWGSYRLFSQRRFFPVSQTQTTLAGIGTGVLGNTYISIGDQNPSGGLVVRMWYHPFVDWIWAGAFLMALGGIISLSDRRFRVGAALRVPRIKAKTEPVPA